MRSQAPLLLISLFALLPLGAGAQYRPPPMTEAERLNSSAQDARLQGSEKMASGDRKGAQADLQRALQLFEKALATDPDLLVAAEGLGSVGNALGESQRVAEALLPVQPRHPDSVALAFELGFALFKLRDGRAVALLEQVSPHTTSEQVLAHFYLANYYLHGQRGELAEAQLLRYLQLRPKAMASTDHQIQLMLGQAYLLQFKPAEARAYFEQSQKGRPESLPAQLGLAQTLIIEEKHSAAVALLEGLNSRFPTAPEPKERLASLALQFGRLRRAEAFGQGLLRLSPTPQAHLLMAEIRIAQKQPAQAESEAQKALALSPELPAAQVVLARAMQLQGRHGPAIQLLEQATQGEGATNIELLAALGSAHRRAGRFQAAIDTHQRLGRLAPDRVRTHELLAADHFAAGQWDQSIEHYGTVLRLEPQNPSARKWLGLAISHRGRISSKTGRLEDAGRDFRRAYDLRQTAETARNLGAVMLAQKQYADAERVLGASLALPGANWRNHQLHGYALLGKGDAGAALEAFAGAEKATDAEEALSEIGAGWALAKLELGEVDDAVSRLSASDGSKAAGAVASANLPLALVRRSLARLSQGAVDEAEQDLEAAERLAVPPRSVTDGARKFARALLNVERGRASQAKAAIRGLRLARADWAQPNADAVLDAYLAYRDAKFVAAKRSLGRAWRRLNRTQRAFAGRLRNGLDAREGELAYARGAYPVAQRAFQAAVKAEPKNPALQHNLACAQYGARKYAPAVAAWQRLEQSVPEAGLNLGIDAQQRGRDVSRALEHYRQYLAAGGSRAATVREWRDRLTSIHAADAALSSGGTP